MPNSEPKKKVETKASIWLVMQEGGSTGEWYSHTFDAEQEAKDYIVSAEKATYNCLDPEEILLHDMVRMDKLEEVLRQETSVIDPDDVDNLLKVIAKES